MKGISRRNFIVNSTMTGAAFAFPTIIPARVLGAASPSHNIHIAQIGCGRIGRDMDVPGLLKCAGSRIVAACDLDSVRLDEMRLTVEKFYEKAGSPCSIATERDYHDLISRPDIDAVSISTPDHWHAQIAVEAAFAGKHVYMQKPASLTIREGRIFSDAIAENDRIFLLGSQQRSSEQFIKACEFVREGRLGKISRIQIGLPGDPPGGGRRRRCPFRRTWTTTSGSDRRRRCSIRRIAFTPSGHGRQGRAGSGASSLARA